MFLVFQIIAFWIGSGKLLLLLREYSLIFKMCTEVNRSFQWIAIRHLEKSWWSQYHSHMRLKMYCLKFLRPSEFDVYTYASTVICRTLLSNVFVIFKSSRPHVFCKKGVTGKHLNQSLFFHKVQTSSLQVSSFEFCEIFIDAYFLEHMWATGSAYWFC